MFFKFKHSKKNLDITDAILRKETQITIGGQSVVIRAFKLAEALQFIEALQEGSNLIKLAGKDFAAFNRYLLAKMPLILKFCLPEYKIDQDKITLAEFADLVLAIYYVNDLERIIANFMTAVQSMPQITQVLAVSPKK